MYAEITHEAFKALVPDEQTVNQVERTEHGFREFYQVHGITVIAVTNYLGAGRQFYIQDINS